MTRFASQTWNDFINCLSTTIQPRWSDMDANQHVNNVKYIGWILEVLLESHVPNKFCVQIRFV